MATASLDSDCSSRRGLDFNPTLVGLLFSSNSPLSSAAEKGVVFASEPTKGPGVVNNDLLGGCLPMIGDPLSFGKSLKRTVLFRAVLEYPG